MNEHPQLPPQSPQTPQSPYTPPMSQGSGAGYPDTHTHGTHPLGTQSQAATTQSPGTRSAGAQPPGGPHGSGSPFDPRFPLGHGQPPYLTPGLPQPRSKIRRGAVGLVAAAVLGAGVLGGAAGAYFGSDGASTPFATVATSAQTVAATTPTDVSAVVAKVMPTVVEISTRTANAQGIGSGVVLTADGRILTNNHVVDGAKEITVTFADGKTAAAEVVGTDANADLAVIQAQGVNGLTAAVLGDSSQLRVGDEVIAIGSPAGLQGTVTTGIVSALDRDVSIPSETGTRGMRGSTATAVSYKAIQTDASINQGNSGGPLFDTLGHVIGINSAIYSPVSSVDGAAGSVGIGFSIPIDTAKEVIAKIS
ncbi:S1C family serine protease [Actinokineospora cianjurensis]|uniref:Putative serine protease PepD n=1 Tax=Actinokineospora cianjurensis TaxID=585224 RepID=A0A421BBE0_9PSEU|nr:trypsin-like peptidase domain-containing protein [Actinokineospora cianjurensis]RLK61675.1 putative serine protease PepD [Actinokineospora cianjurensis]